MARQRMYSETAARATAEADPLDRATVRLAEAAATHRAEREARMTRLSCRADPGTSSGEPDPGPAPHLETFDRPGGPPEAFLVNDRRAAAAFGVSAATLWRGVKDGRFPRPVRAGGCTRWVWDEIEETVRTAIDARDGRGG